MADEFDPYYEWLGIPPKDQPPHHYRLLGIELFEQNLNVVERAADRQMGHVRSFQTGRHSNESQRLLNELSAAKVCLLNSKRKIDYDLQLQQQLASRSLPDDGLPGSGPVPELPPGVAETTAESASFVPAGRTIELRQLLDAASVAGVRRRQPSSLPRKPKLIGTMAAVIALGGVLFAFYWLILNGDLATDPIAPPNANPNVTQSEPANPVTPPSAGTPSPTTSANVPPTQTPAEIPVLPTVSPTTQSDNSRIAVINESLTEIAYPPSLPEAPAVPSDVSETISAAAGMVDSRFAFCQTLLWKQFEATNLVLRTQGYRVSRCRPYLAKGDWRVAAIWLRDGLPSRVVGLTDASTLLQADQRLRDQGFVPVDVFGGADGTLELFAAVWVRPKSPVGEAMLTLGVAAEAYEEPKEEMLRKGFRSAVHLAYFFTGGKRKYCDLWIKPPVGRGLFVWTGDRAYASKQLARDAIQTDVGVTTNPANGGVLFIGSQWLGAKDVMKPFVGMPPDALREAAVEQVGAGYLPASLSVACTANGDLIGVALWRPADQLLTPLELARLDQPANTTPTSSPQGPSAKPMVEKLTPPANNETEVAKIRDVFKGEIAAAKEPLALAALAEKLLTQAAVEQEPAIQYALLGEARRLAVDGIDWKLAARAIEELASRFQVDEWTLRAEVFGGLNKKAKVSTDRKILAETALTQAEAALGASELEVVDSLLSSASNLAPRGDRDLVKQVSDLRKRLSEEKKVEHLVRDARAKLAESPDDAVANETLGRYLCFTKGDWETGIRQLAKGPEGKLTLLARSDEARPSDAADRATVADAWSEFAKSATDSISKGGATNRALYWYQLALPDLSGVKKLHVEKQIEDLSKSVPSARGKPKFAWLDGEPGVAMELRGHTGDVSSLAIARSGRFLVSGSQDDTVRIWELLTGKPAGQITSGTGDVNAFLLSPDDRTVAIPVYASGEYSIGIWSLQNGQPVGSIKADGMARHLAGSQDWRRVVYPKNQSGAANLLVYNLATLTPVASLNCPGTPVQIAVSRSGRFLAAADDNNGVYVWDMQTGKPMLPLTGHTNPVTGLAFSPNERQLASSGYGTMIVWDLAKGLEERRVSLQDGVAATLTFSPDGSRLLVSGLTMEVSVYNVQDGTRIAQVRATSSETSLNTSAIVCFSDGRAVATVGQDNLIRIWRLPP